MDLRQALVGSREKIKKLVFVSPVFYPSYLGLRFQKTRAGNIVGYHRKFSFIKTYPAPGWVYDTVLALKGTACKKIVFVGTAASINFSYQLGEIVSSDMKVKVKSIKSFWQETKSSVNKLRRQGYDAVDFELQAFLAACRRVGRQSKFFLLIEDLLPSKPFYRISSKGKQKIEKGKRELATLCLTLAQKP